MKNNNNTITVVWCDAVIFKEGDIIPKTLPVITTTGTLIKKTSKYLLLENTKSKSSTRRKILPKDSANYYFIPTGMIMDIQ